MSCGGDTRTTVSAQPTGCKVCQARTLSKRLLQNMSSEVCAPSVSVVEHTCGVKQFVTSRILSLQGSSVHSTFTQGHPDLPFVNSLGFASFELNFGVALLRNCLHFPLGRKSVGPCG